MEFFNKILVQETKTGNLTDITNLDQPHYESFLDTINKLRIAYYVAIERMQKDDICCPYCHSDDIVWYGLSGDCVCNQCGKEGSIIL